MSASAEADSETRRIQFLLERDGYDATRAWVDQTLKIYRQALAHPGSLATEPIYRWRFERSVREFELWLSQHS